MKACVFTLGCKVNEVESASIMSTLEKYGFETSAKLEYADIYVLNTCAVTRESEKKSRQLVARARKFNPSAKIYVCGCASEKDSQSFLDRDCEVFGAKDKLDVVNSILKSVNGAYCGGFCYPKQVKTRAFVKITDGCNNFCSYCIIPYLRGRVNSRSIEDIMGEIAQIDSQEIVLTGINISAFNVEGKTLIDLIKAMKGVDKRVRLGSLECGVIVRELLGALNALKSFAPQFHLSLQSGSNSVLRAMNRKYTREEYIEKCNLIYEFFPDAAITTDIIVGFPTETDADFEDSVRILNEVKMARVHVFPFSPREGTVAYKMKDIAYSVKEERRDRLLKAAEKAENDYCKRFDGKTACVLWEDFDGEYTHGFTENYINVYAKGNRQGVQEVLLTNLKNNSFYIE